MECCDNSGGRAVITVDGVRYSARSAVTIRPTVTEREAGANQDNTIFTNTKPVPAEVELTLSDRCGLDLDTLMAGCHIDVTIDLIDMKRTYLFTRASVVGRPEIDSESGEISGVMFVSAAVRTLHNA